MSKLTLAVWTLVLANAVIAFAGLILGIAFEFIFKTTLEGGREALPWISENFINHPAWFFAGFTVPLFLAAVFMSVRRRTTAEGTLVFGAITLLNISFQILFAATAFSLPFAFGISVFAS